MTHCDRLFIGASLVLSFLFVPVSQGQVALSPSEVQDFVAAVTNQQEFLSHVSVEFDALISGEALTLRNGSRVARDVSASVRYVREFDREMLDVAFDVPDGARRTHPFIDERVFLEPGRMITHFARTSQVLINAERDFPIIPNPKLILTAGLRCDLGQALAQGATISASRALDGIVTATVTTPWLAGDAAIEIVVDPKMRHSIIAWSSEKLNQSATILWRMGEGERLVPAEVVWTSRNDPDRRWTMRLTTFSTDSAKLGASGFEFQPGMIVTDYLNPETPGKSKSYRIGENGEPEAILMIPATPEVSPKAVGAVSAATGALVLAVAALRLRMTSKA